MSDPALAYWEDPTFEALHTALQNFMRATGFNPTTTNEIVYELLEEAA